jgi:hypothetical protein
MVRRRLKHKLAVSTVIANLLMIMITLSLAAILVAWAGTSFGAFSGGSQLFYVQRGQALQERFTVEYVNFTRPTGITLFVRNVGVEEINVASIYVNGTSYSGSEMGPVSPCTTSIVFGVTVVRIVVGNVCQFNLTWTPTWSSGSVFNIVVATTRGNQATVNMRGP